MMQISNQKMHHCSFTSYFYSPISLLWYTGVSCRQLFLLLLPSLLTRDSLTYKIIATCCSVSVTRCVAIQPGHRLPCKLPALARLLRCPLAIPSAPWEQVAGAEQPKVLHAEIWAPEWIILILTRSKGFCLPSS